MAASSPAAGQQLVAQYAAGPSPNRQRRARRPDRPAGAPDLLLGLAAERGGYAERPEVGEKVTAEKERLLLQGLWEELLEDALEVSEEEARAHYEAHPEMYWAPEEIVVQEIMVADESLAQELLEQIRNGADMAALATKHSIRRDADENGGLYALRAFEKIIYKELMDAAVSAPERELQGPLELVDPLPTSLRDPQPLERAFSIFKVLQRQPKRVQEYELSQTEGPLLGSPRKTAARIAHPQLAIARQMARCMGYQQRSSRKVRAGQAVIKRKQRRFRKFFILYLSSISGVKP